MIFSLIHFSTFFLKISNTERRKVSRFFRKSNNKTFTNWSRPHTVMLFCLLIISELWELRLRLVYLCVFSKNVMPLGNVVDIGWTPTRK